MCLCCFVVFSVCVLWFMFPLGVLVVLFACLLFLLFCFPGVRVVSCSFVLFLLLSCAVVFDVVAVCC